MIFFNNMHIFVMHFFEFLFICGDVYIISMNNGNFYASLLLSCSVESIQQNYHLHGVLPNSNLLCSM